MTFNRFAQEAWVNRRQRIAARREREALSPAHGVRIRSPYRDTTAQPTSSIPADVAAHNSRVRDNV
jgi:hypothetical protein